MAAAALKTGDAPSDHADYSLLRSRHVAVVFWALYACACFLGTTLGNVYLHGRMAVVLQKAADNHSLSRTAAAQLQSTTNLHGMIITVEPYGMRLEHVSNSRFLWIV